MNADTEKNLPLSHVLVPLMKGVLYQDDNPALWQSLLDLQARVRDTMKLFGLELTLDEAEGYAFLRQPPQDNEGSELPRLVARRQLSYPVSLLLALLRKRLAEFDAGSSEARLILSTQDMVDMVRLFMPDTSNEVKVMGRIEAHINKVVEMGFLRRLRQQNDQYEVRRILKAFVDAQWLNQFAEQMALYRDYLLNGDLLNNSLFNGDNLNKGKASSGARSGVQDD